MSRDAGESADISLFVCFWRLLPSSSCSLPNPRQGSHDRVPLLPRPAQLKADKISVSFGSQKEHSLQELNSM